ncbi:MAG: tetratricopeptide repeat protein, partial [Peristeroidobacter soli]
PDASRLDAVRPRIDALANLPADSEQFWLNSAAIQMALGQMDLARAALTQARTKSPASFQAPLALAQLEFRAGEPAKALALTSELAEKFPNQPEVLAVHAKMLGAANRAAESAALLERLQAQAPSSSLALAIHQVRKQGSLPNPNEPLERWLANNPRDLPMRAAYAEVLQNDGQNRRAIGEYETLVGLAPKSAPAINNLAWLYYLEHDDRAVATARRAWEIAPKVATIADTYGWLLVDSGKVREGIELLEEADAAGGILQPEIRLHLVVALDRQGDKERSQALLKALMAESPEFPNQAEAARLLDSLRQPGAT